MKAISGLPAWLAWRAVYLGKLPGVRRKVQVAVDWACRTLFPPSIVELPMAKTGPLARAHYAAGEYVFHKGDATDCFFVIEHGTAGIYLDERRPPLALLTAGDVFGETAVLAPDGPRPVSARAEAPLRVAWLGGEDLRRLGPAPALERGAEKIYGALSALIGRMPDFGRAPVSEAMSRPPHTLSPALRVEEALARFTDGQPGYPVVDEEGVLLGYCGVAELYGALAGQPAPEMRVGDIMRRDPPVLAEERSMAEAAVLLHRREEVLAATAADGSGKIIGVLTRLDFLRSLFTFVRRNDPAGAPAGPTASQGDLAEPQLITEGASRLNALKLGEESRIPATTALSLRVSPKRLPLRRPVAAVGTGCYYRHRGVILAIGSLRTLNRCFPLDIARHTSKG